MDRAKSGADAASSDSKRAADDIRDTVNFVRQYLAAKAQAAQRLRNRRLLLRSVFEDAYQYMKSGTLLRQVINRLQSDIDFNDSKSRHLFGEIYETILQGLQGAGNAGEYYTPRAVTQFAVDMVDPRLGERILDPACGTGGFLSCAIENIRAAQVKRPEQEARLQASIRGVDEGFRWLLRRALTLIPDASRYDLHPYVANGFDISVSRILLTDNFLPLVGYLVPWFILAFYLINYREIANPM